MSPRRPVFALNSFFSAGRLLLLFHSREKHAKNLISSLGGGGTPCNVYVRAVREHCVIGLHFERIQYLLLAWAETRWG